MQVFAHRGASQDHPENTLEAFSAALAAGATGIETDLRLSRDGTIVLVHDEDLLRTAGDPRRVEDLSAEELRAATGGPDRGVPTLDDLWDLAAGRVRLNLELKAPGVGAALARHLAGRQGEVLVTSFSLEELETFRAARPAVPAGPVLERLGARERALLARGGYQAVSLAVDAFAEGHPALCREAGAELLLWVVNAPERVLHLAGAGVDGIFTDCPSLVVPALRPLLDRRGRRVP